MRRIVAAAVLAAMCALSACKKTGEGEYEVQKPVVGTQSDTVHTPSVDVSTETTSVTTPKVEVKKDTSKVRVPKVEVKKPDSTK
ncbi:MAG TPA: hypothetical protein VF041_17595 [Gemmatimonadaceae bacterium]